MFHSFFYVLLSRCGLRQSSTSVENKPVLFDILHLHDMTAIQQFYSTQHVCYQIIILITCIYYLYFLVINLNKSKIHIQLTQHRGVLYINYVTQCIPSLEWVLLYWIYRANKPQHMRKGTQGLYYIWNENNTPYMQHRILFSVSRRCSYKVSLDAVLSASAWCTDMLCVSSQLDVPTLTY